MSERYTLGNNPLRVDPRRVLLVKILNSINAGGGGGGGSGTGLSGVGSPEGVVTADAGSTYVNTATGDFYWKNGSGNTGWLP